MCVCVCVCEEGGVNEGIIDQFYCEPFSCGEVRTIINMEKKKKSMVMMMLECVKVITRGSRQLTFFVLFLGF